MHGMPLLRTILDLLFPLGRTAGLVRDATGETIGRVACPIRIEGDVVALMPYRAPIARACVIEAKFKDNERAQELLAGVLADYLNEWSAGEITHTPGSLVLVPVPLSEKRRKSRGYNQAERIARKAAAQLPDVYLDTDLLSRTRDTLPQTKLGAHARRKNLLGAFEATSAPDSEHTYIVFDDVMTTGATLSAAMQALTDAGASRVLGIALAH